MEIDSPGRGLGLGGMEIDMAGLGTRHIEIIIDGPNVAIAKAQATPHQPRNDAAAVRECGSYFEQQGVREHCAQLVAVNSVIATLTQ